MRQFSHAIRSRQTENILNSLVPRTAARSGHFLGSDPSRIDPDTASSGLVGVCSGISKDPSSPASSASTANAVRPRYPYPQPEKGLILELARPPNVDRVIEQLRENLFAPRIIIPIRNDTKDFGEHRCAHAQVGAGVNLQFRSILRLDNRGDLGHAYSGDCARCRPEVWHLADNDLLIDRPTA